MLEVNFALEYVLLLGVKNMYYSGLLISRINRRMGFFVSHWNLKANMLGICLDANSHGLFGCIFFSMS